MQSPKQKVATQYNDYIRRTKGALATLKFIGFNTKQKARDWERLERILLEELKSERDFKLLSL